MTRMGGLQVDQNARALTNSFQQSPSGTAPIDTTSASGPTFISCGSPVQYSQFIQKITAIVDNKVYMRQMRVRGVMFNQSNTPIYVHRFKFVVKKNIPLSEYTNFGQLFGANIPGTPINQPLVDYTTSNTAQRYLKFLGTKYIHMNCGALRRFTINRKWRTPKVVTNEIEGDLLNYFALKGQVVYAFKVIPSLLINTTGTFPNQTLGTPFFGSWCLLFRVVDYTSGYQIGLNDPNSTYSPVTLNPATQRSYTPMDQQWASQSISGNASG